MLVRSRYGGCGRGIWRSIEDGTVTVKGAGTYLRAIVRQGQVVEQIQRAGADCTIMRYGHEYTVKRAGKIVQQVFYEPGTLHAMRRGGLWKRQTDLKLCGSEGVLECYSTAGGLYRKEVFTYSNGVKAYVANRHKEGLEVFRPDGKLWVLLEGPVRPGFHPIAQRLNPNGNDVGLTGLWAGLNLKVTVYGPSGTRVVTQGAYVNRRREGRWLENGKVSYYLSGVKVSRKICEEDPDQWDAWEVLRIPNAQLRSSFLNKMGYKRLLEKVEHEVINTDDDGSQLLAITVIPDRHTPPGIDRTMRLLRVVCPSTHASYVLRVPPEVQSCQQARHWTLGLDLDNVKDGSRFDLIHET
jgi:hypothetical protein